MPNIIGSYFFCKIVEASLAILKSCHRKRNVDFSARNLSTTLWYANILSVTNIVNECRMLDKQQLKDGCERTYKSKCKYTKYGWKQISRINFVRQTA